MKCLVCNTGEMIEKLISETIDLEGAPSFEIHGVQKLECNTCRDVLIESGAARTRTQKIINELVRMYGVSRVGRTRQCQKLDEKRCCA